jgi:hypothetical protein
VGRELDGSERDLTPGEKMKANFLGWSRDRKSFFFSTNERDPRPRISSATISLPGSRRA